MDMHPFDLEAAKHGQPVCTRDGRKVRIICFDAIGYRQPIIALVTNFDGKEDIETHYRPKEGVPPLGSEWPASR